VSVQGFSSQTDRMLDRADAACLRRGSRLTDLRRQVLGLVLEAGRPVGAYDLLDKLRTGHKAAAPPTVYRALDFLLEEGLVHKVERLSAFVGCVHELCEEDDNCGHDHSGSHAAQFLICSNCGSATEIDDPSIQASLAAAARRAGFKAHKVTVEAEGLCARCAAAAAEAAPQIHG